MIFKVEKYKIEISENILKIFEEFKQLKENAPESGGILLGQVKDNYIFLSKATTPCREDSSSRFSFIRNRNIAQLIVDYEFYNNNGHVIYLGEWHTHPENNPAPSQQDYKMIKNQYKKNNLNEDYILMLIVGIKKIYLEMYNGKTNLKGKLIDEEKQLLKWQLRNLRKKRRSG
jgi:integrative and conjugative element protein (TIGR02256 family)